MPASTFMVAALLTASGAHTNTTACVALDMWP